MPNAAGCDSILTIDLTISGTTVQSEIAEKACFKYTSPSGNKVWTTSGVYFDTLTSAVGCDSIVSVNLTIDTVDIKVTKSGKTLNATTNNAGHQWIKCSNNEPIDGAITPSYTPTKTGNYAVIVFYKGCVDTSDCYKVTIVGLSELSKDQGVVLYPNPTNGSVSIELEEAFSQVDLMVTNAEGKLVQTIDGVSPSRIQFELNQPAGLYLVHIYADDQYRAVKVVKE